MADIRRIMYIDAISTTSVQFRRHSQFGPLPEADPGSALHQVNVITGNAAAFNADTAFFQTNCTPYEIVIRRLG